MRCPLESGSQSLNCLFLSLCVICMFLCMIAGHKVPSGSCLWSLAKLYAWRWRLRWSIASDVKQIYLFNIQETTYCRSFNGIGEEMKFSCTDTLWSVLFPLNHLIGDTERMNIRSLYVLIAESDTGMTAFVVKHFQGLCQQSSLVSFSKTPRALSLISVGKYHGNGAGKSWHRLSQQTHALKAQRHTAAAARVSQ